MEKIINGDDYPWADHWVGTAPYSRPIGGKCVKKDKYCDHTRQELKTTGQSGGKAILKFVKAKLKANRELPELPEEQLMRRGRKSLVHLEAKTESDRLREKVKRVIGHYSSLKGTIKEMCSE